MIYTVGIPYIGEQEVSISFVKEYFKDVKEVQFDTETEGFDEYTKQVLCFQLGDYNNQFVIHGSLLGEFKEFLQSKTLLGQGIKFDLKFLYQQDIYPNSVWDTYLAECVIFCGIDKRKSLKVIANERLGIDLDKSIRENIWEKGLTNEVIEYAANDVKYLSLIKESQLKDIEERDLGRALQVENAFVLCLAYIEHCGFKLDKDKWKAKCDKDYEAFVHAKSELDKWIVDNNISIFINNQLTLFSDEVNVSSKINWSSSKQVGILFKHLKIPISVEKDGQVKESVDSKNITKHAKEFPILDKYLHYKKLEKLVGTYGYDWIDGINPVTGRLHTQFRQIMDTGRLSSGGKNKATKEEYRNFQNIPSDPETRSCFVAGEGNVLLISDYSGQEQVVLANKSLDPALLEFYDNGFGDMHSFVASKMYPELEGMSLEDIKKQHKEKRQAAKTAGFAINYGGNGSTIARNNNLTQEEGDAVYEAYFTAFGGLRNYFKEVQDQAMRDGFILINEHLNRKTFIAGFDRFLEEGRSFTSDFWTEYRGYKQTGGPQFDRMREKVSKWFRFKGAIERMALNYPIQGSSADITKISCIYIFNWIKEHNLLGKVLFANTIHDENVLDCPEEIADEVASALEIAMNNAALKFCKRIKLTASPEKSLYWKK